MNIAQYRLELFKFGFDSDQSVEVLQYIEDNDNDFELNDYRFIHKDAIDKIQCDELLGDLYCLGCFNASFLSECTDIDSEIIEVLQDSGAFEALGKLVKKDVSTIQERYVGYDGYGHHFAHYDNNEHGIGDYLVFRIN